MITSPTIMIQTELGVCMHVYLIVFNSKIITIPSTFRNAEYLDIQNNFSGCFVWAYLLLCRKNRNVGCLKTKCLGKYLDLKWIFLGCFKTMCWEKYLDLNEYYIRRKFMIYTEHFALLIRGGGNGLKIMSNGRIWY